MCRVAVNHATSARRLTRRLLALVGPYWRWMALAALLGFFTVASSVLLLANAALIIASAALRPSIAALQVAIVGVRFFGIARGVLRYLERLASHRATFRLLARLRVWFYAALEPLAPAGLAGYRSGDLLARIIADIETLQNFYGRVVAPPAVAILTALLMMILLGHYSLSLALTLLAFLLVADLAVPALVVGLSRRAGQQSVAARAALSAVAVESVQGMSELVAFGRQTAQQAKLAASQQELEAAQRRLAGVAALNDALGLLIAGLATLAVVAVAVPLVRAAQLSGVELAVVALASLACFEAVLPLAQAAQHLESNLEAARRLFEIVDTPPAVSDADTPAPPDAAPGTTGIGIRLEDVRFRYAPGEPLALDGLRMDVAPGQRVAVVGPSGAGKSTVLNLLLRLWDAQEGRVLLGGRDIRSLAAEDVRRLIGVVTQQTYLFNTTIRENLLLARRDATEAELLAAAEQAQIHAFVMGLPQQYETWVGEQGLRLSGGERQRLAIARALLKNAPVLILDEATANLDTLTERDVWAAMQRLAAGRTTLVITHRLVVMESFDNILVLHQGRLAQQGSHRELLAQGGLYRDMWRLQNQVVTFGQGATLK